MSTPLPQANGGRILAAVLIGTLGSAVLFSASLAVPLLGFGCALLAPTPLVVARQRGGRAAAAFAALFTSLLLAVGQSPAIGAWYLAQCGLIGLVSAELLLREVRPFRTIIWSTAAAAGLTVVLLSVFTITSATDPQVFITREVSNGIAQALKLYEQQSGLRPDELETFKQGLQKVGEIMLRIYPALATVNLALISAVTVLLFNRAASRNGAERPGSSLKTFRVPEPLVWLLIGAGFAMLVPSSLITTPALNLLVLLGILYGIQGLAVLLTLADRTSFDGTLKVLLTIMLVTQPYLIGIVVIIGIFDYWGEFRTPRTTQDENL